MAIELAAVYVPVMPSLKGAAATIQRELGGVNLSSVGSKLGGSLGTTIADGLGAVGRIGATITATVGAAVAGIALKGGIDRALAIENAQAKLVGLGHSAESVSTLMENALNSVKGTAFGLGDAATVAAGLSASGVRAGAEMESVLKAVADTAQISGRSLSDVGTIFGSVAARGKLQGDDMLQLMSAGVPVLQLVSKQLGVTSADVSDMVSKGEIDFETFYTSLQAGFGGAALAAGETFTGALANVRAALGRVGAAAATPVLNGLRDTFNALIPVIDKVAASLTPLFEAFAGKVASAAPAVGAAFASIGDSIANIAENGLGPFGAMFAAVGPIIAGAIAPLLSGLPIIGKLFAGITPQFGILVGVIAALLAASPELRSALGDLGGAFAALAEAVLPQLTVILGAVVGLMPMLGDSIAAIVRVAAKAISWLSQYGDALMVVGVAVTAGVVAFRAYTAVAGAVAAAQAIYAALTYGAAGATYANIAATKLQVIAGRVAAGVHALQSSALYANIVAWVANTKAVLANTSLTVGTKAAIIASSVATGIATAAQWAWNAALSANPIGVVVLAVAALVAGLIWFFTQTELGQAIWAEFSRFMGEAWENISAGAAVAFEALGGFFESMGSKLATGADQWAGFFDATRDGLQGFSDRLALGQEQVGGFIGTVGERFALGGQQIGDFAGSVGGFMGQVGARFSEGGQQIGQFAAVVGARVGEAIGWIAGLPGRAASALGNLGNTLYSSGRALIQGFIDGITSMVRAVGDAVGGVIDWAAGFFPNSPAERGPLSGSGWTRLRHSGAAVMEQFGLGFGDAGQLESSLSSSFAVPDTRLAGGGRLGSRGELASQAVYVQNPFTGEYLLSRVDERADGRIGEAKYRSAVRLSSGGVSA